MRRYLLLLLTIFQFIYATTEAQTTCGSTFNQQLLQSLDSARYNRYIQLEQHIANYVSSLSGGGNGRLINPNSTIIIPVVVHVLHIGEAVGVGNNISAAQVQSQIDVLNEDFRRLNADRINTPAAFAGVAADPNFEFRLACVDPDGNVTNGIHRVQTNINAFTFQANANGSPNELATGIKFTSQGGTNAWPTDRYLNIWVCNIAPFTNGQLLGYAQFPFDFATSPNTDGVVILNTAFGRVGNLMFQYDEGRTTTHEIGHWLGVFHIWGDNACGDDNCNDTPQQFTANQSNCPAFPHQSICPNNGVNGDMFMNYMDYTLDGCKNTYTGDQRNRMRAVFAQGGPRASFINNYFRINDVPLNLCGVSTVSVTNPMCLPVAWTVTGPVNVVNNGNSVTLTQTGTGIATVTATAGGYTDTKQVQIGLATPIFGITTMDGCDFEALGYSNNPQQSVTYNWYIDGNLYSHWTKIHGTINDGSVIELTVSNAACGTSDGYWEREYCSYSLLVFPNPASDDITVETTDGSRVGEVRILDKLGNIKKQIKFNSKNKKEKINLTNLSMDIYTIQVWNGQKWVSRLFSKQ